MNLEGFIVKEVTIGLFGSQESTTEAFFKAHFFIISLVIIFVLYIGTIYLQKSGRGFLGPILFLLGPPITVLLFYIELHYNFAIYLLAQMLWAIVFFCIRLLEIDFSKMLRSDQAIEIMDALRLGKTECSLPSYCLFIRSFYTTNALIAQCEQGSSGEVEPVDLEIVLWEALKYMGPLIALGEPDEMLGAGRILSSEATWRNDMNKLIKNAALIIVLPSNREGVLWEIKCLQDSAAMDKTVWIMPEKPEFPTVITLMSHIEYFDCREEWRKAREALLKYGIELPHYCDSGKIFRINSSGKPYGDHTLYLTHTLNAVRKIRKILLEYRFEPKNYS